MLRRVVELETSQDAPRLVGREDLVEVLRPVGAEVVEHDADPLGVRVVNVDEIAHAVGEVGCRPLVGHLGVSPRPIHVDKHEDVRGAVAHVLVVDPRGRSRLAGTGTRASPMSWLGVSSKQTTGRCAFGRSA